MKPIVPRRASQGARPVREAPLDFAPFDFAQGWRDKQEEAGRRAPFLWVRFLWASKENEHQSKI
jgi:hypothetical protein